MKTKEFVQVLRKLIREEVQVAVRAELKSFLTENKQQVKQQPASKPTQTRFNTGNMTLDEILSETIVPRGFGGESGPMVTDYEDFGFTTNNINTNTSIAGDDALPNFGYGDPTMQFVKDYSAVLKKADQISGKK